MNTHTADGRRYLTKREYTALKSRLTRAQHSGDPSRVIAECERAFDLFDETVWPDDWHRWNIAEGDAYRAIGRPFDQPYR